MQNKGYYAVQGYSIVITTTSIIIITITIILKTVNQSHHDSLQLSGATVLGGYSLTSVVRMSR